MDNVFLKPARDADGKPLVVPDPDTHERLKAEGEWKPRSIYWARRILDKDVTEATPPKVETAAAASYDEPVSDAVPAPTDEPSPSRSRAQKS